MLRLFEAYERRFPVLSFFLSPGVILGLVLVESIFWTSPKWAQAIHWPTYEGQQIAAVERCKDLLQKTCEPKLEVVHDSGEPIPFEALPEWTPMRIEQRFASGFVVVSALGPHENFQYLVRELPATLREGTYFRRFHGRTFLN